MNKRQLLASMVHEIRVAKHLYGKLPKGALDYRPGPGQRSTLELLRYLTYCGIGTAKASLAGSFEAVKPYAQAAASLSAEEFPAAMDRQEAALREAIEGISDADYAERDVALAPMIQGKLCEALVNTSLKFLTAYRMQLFLYAKASGAADLDTWDCWRGTTNPKKAAATA